MKKTFMLLLSVIWAAAAFSQDSVVVKGNVLGDTKGYNKLIVHFSNGLPEDSAFLSKDGKFEYQYPYRPEVSVTIYMEYDIKVRQRVFPFVVVTDGKAVLEVKDADVTKSLFSGQLSGTKTPVDYLLLQQQYMNLTDKAKDSLTATMTTLVGQFVSTHPKSFASVAAIRNYSLNLDTDQIESFFGRLSDELQKSTGGKAIATHIEGLKRSALGSKVPDFILPTPDDKAFSFKSLRGKYVLIDFWASWCGPCKASFPHLKEVYAAYKGNQFEILGISIDRNKEAWLDELSKQELPWLQTLDNQNISRNTFAIVGVPTTYLISPNGEIMLKEIGFQENGRINQKLKELFGDMNSL